MSDEARICDEPTIASLVEAMQSDRPDAMGQLDRLIDQYDSDARLCFMKASVLLGAGKPIEAHPWFVRSLQLAPDFAIARFQFGLFQLTSGEPAQALETWGRLDLLPDGHYLRSFVDGLRCLIRDDFEGVRQHFTLGMVANTENPPLNKDMSMLLRQIESLPAPHATGSSSSPSLGGDQATKERDEGVEEELSETSILLQQFGQKGRFH
jgi:hypothetical protein